MIPPSREKGVICVGEKNLLAFFKSPEDAEEAKRRLQALGIDTVRITPVDRFPSEDRDWFPLSLSGGMPLAKLTEEKVPSGRNEAILMAANPVSSGMSDGEGSVSGYNHLLIAVMDEALHHEAISIVREMGAIF